MITFEQVIAWDKRFNPEAIKKLFAGRKVLTIDDICNLDIDARTRLELLSHEELTPASVLAEFACRIAKRALALAGHPDPRSVAAIAAKRAWLRGEIDDVQLREARQAALTAFHAITRTPAKCAAMAAVGTTECDSASSYNAVRASAHSVAEWAVEVGVRTSLKPSRRRTPASQTVAAQLEILRTLLEKST
jgi:hypothetical protein